MIANTEATKTDMKVGVRDVINQKPVGSDRLEERDLKATIVETAIGLLAFDEGSILREQLLYAGKPEAAARTLSQLETGTVTNELVELVDRLKKKGFDTLVFENDRLANNVRQKLSVTAEVQKQSTSGERARENIEQLALETGFARNPEELRSWMHDVAVELAKIRVKGSTERRDLLVSQAVQTLDELDRTINMLMTRVREWYGVHFPELDRLLEKHETYSRLVEDLGNRANFTVEKLENEDIPKAKAEGIAKVAEKSMGADMAESDLTPVQALCRNLLEMYKLRQNMENYLDSTMEEVAPNTRLLVGSLLGARLIAVSGGLVNLAKRPASTIQVLGAEKALFRSLKTGTRPPKHGLIFQHTLLHDAKRWQRGKIARALAGKLAIAARADAFGGRYIGQELKKNMDKRIEEIREKYDQPPQPSPKQTEFRKEREPRGRDLKKWRRPRRER